MVGEVDGAHFIAMDFLEGQPLDRIRSRAVDRGLGIPLALVCHIFIEALDGLGHAHDLRDSSGEPLSVVHRDVSPRSLFVTYDGEVKLLDFGIAKASSRLVHTETGTVKRKLAYMAPELARCEPIDHRADIWSMGVVMWEVLAGQRLFERDSEVATLAAVLDGPVPRLAEVAPEVPPRLAAIVERALDRELANRYQSAADMRADIEAFVAQRGCHVGRTQVAELMKAAFADLIGEHQALVGQCREEGVGVVSRPAGDRTVLYGVSLLLVAAVLVGGLLLFFLGSGGEDDRGPGSATTLPVAGGDTTASTGTRDAAAAGSASAGNAPGAVEAGPPEPDRPRGPRHSRTVRTGLRDAPAAAPQPGPTLHIRTKR